MAQANSKLKQIIGSFLLEKSELTRLKGDVEVGFVENRK